MIVIVNNFVFLSVENVGDFMIVKEKYLKAIRGYYDCDLMKANYNLVR